MTDDGKFKTPINAQEDEHLQPMIGNKNGSHNLPKLLIPKNDTVYHEKVKIVATPAKPNAKKKKKKRDKSDLGDNFVAPDGGWGWFVAIASGVNILVTFAMAQQFGIIFRDHMANLGISSSQLTTIINTQVAVSAITGLLNGPLFRKYTYRRVALVGSLLTFVGLFACVFSNSFVFYVLSFSCCYGFGRGLTVSASSLAVNTFFKEKRRTATAFQFGVAGMGPIFLPFLATFLLDLVGVRYTVLFFAGLSLNTIACSLIYQPVKWHVKKQPYDAEASQKLNSSESHDHHHIIAQPVEPDTPVLPRANDGWYGSRTSLNGPYDRSRLGSLERQRKYSEGSDYGVELKRLNSLDSSSGELKRLNSLESNKKELKRLNSSENKNNNEIAGKKRTFSVSHSIKEEAHEDDQHDEQHPELNGEKQLKEKNDDKNIKEEEEEEEEKQKKLSFFMKVVIFFDLDLLRDITYVNLSMGLTLINFVEINFAILTPFILSDFGFNKAEIAMAMSALGLCDLIVRFLVPIITAKINLSNQAFFAVGILGMCIGRVFLSFTTNFYAMMTIFVWLGLNKAFRTVFWSLIIPGYVPLKRLPAAAGLQLLMSGVFSMACGPIIGLIRDNTSYAFALNFLNSLCILALALWLLESLVRRYRNKSKPVTEDLN